MLGTKKKLLPPQPRAADRQCRFDRRGSNCRNGRRSGSALYGRAEGGPGVGTRRGGLGCQRGPINFALCVTKAAKAHYRTWHVASQPAWQAHRMFVHVKTSQYASLFPPFLPVSLGRCRGAPAVVDRGVVGQQRLQPVPGSAASAQRGCKSSSPRLVYIFTLPSSYIYALFLRGGGDECGWVWDSGNWPWRA